MHQIEAVSLDMLVSPDHLYRRFLNLLDFNQLVHPLSDLIKQEQGTATYGIVRLFKCLLLQFMEDLSGRELEKFLRENVAAKLFCGFNLMDKTPDHSLFTRVRDRIGTERMGQMFEEAKRQLHAKGHSSHIFSFVDASQLIAKTSLWEERDKAIAEKYEKLNNEVLPKVAVDKQARIGCKGKSKFWYGYKKHVCVDIQSGLIEKVAITPANVTDASGLKHICPRNQAVYADKGYCVQTATRILSSRNCHNASIKKNNMKTKDRDKDRWISGVRMPYERVFSQWSKLARYRGIAKNQFAAFGYAFCFNVKRMLVLEASPPLALAVA